MRITSLSLRNVGRHRDAEWTLSPGLTVVRGPNESGKSTLLRAIELGLTRSATSTAPDLAGLRSWDAAADESPAVAMSFAWEDDEGLGRTGRLAKVFAGPAGSTLLELDGQVVADPARAEQMLAELSGVPSEGFLRSTASVRQAELADLDRDEQTLRERLAATISGADRGTARARRRLEAAIAELAPRNGGPGRLGTAADAVADAERRLATGEEGLARLEQDRDAHAAARERRAEAEAALAQRRAQLETARQAERVRAQLEDARARHERYAEAVALRDELAELEATHPSATPLRELRPAVERLRSLDARIATLERLLADEVHVDFDLAPETRWRPRSRAGLLLVVVGLALAAAGVVSAGVLGGALGVIVAAVGLALHATAIRARDADRATRQMRDEEVARRLRGRSDWEEELRLGRTERDGVLASLGLPGTVEAEERLAAEIAHVARIDAGVGRLADLVGSERPDALPAKRDGAAAEVQAAEADLTALGPIAREPRARERLEAEVRDAVAVADRARDDEAAARARVEQNPVNAEDVAGLAERLATWRADLARLRRGERILARTLAELDAAERATMARATRFLERRMVGDLARVTGGRYREIRIDDGGLGFDVRSAERGDWVPVTALSRGTLDAVYLAARIALVRLVTGDRRPPLLLDDPLVSLDDDRSRRALAALRELAADFQVVYLTASDRFDAVADQVITLAGPEGVADS